MCPPDSVCFRTCPRRSSFPKGARVQRGGPELSVVLWGAVGWLRAGVPVALWPHTPRTKGNKLLLAWGTSPLGLAAPFTSAKSLSRAGNGVCSPKSYSPPSLPHPSTVASTVATTGHRRLREALRDLLRMSVLPLPRWLLQHHTNPPRSATVPQQECILCPQAQHRLCPQAQHRLPLCCLVGDPPF